ncbi:hypothetical protein PN36_33855 [Candidatus Thiomargarita nelsonii]|uniref:DUF5675 domain-containing protein n=1 Tax=Candidatus Thiomargarita nelsonii TaxID=1003181 RepID=A0A0A6RWX5_9GAMM|nr:hypothetical protein PN36_33855 [Candidatus Thiomargarita nelsonii]
MILNGIALNRPLGFYNGILLPFSECRKGVIYLLNIFGQIQKEAIMAWNFLYLCRSSTTTHWGKLYLFNDKQTWEFFCDTYELLWRADSKGRSKSSKSRIRNGKYEIKVRTDGSKGWRLELSETGHRTYIQIHRAHKTMYIEGCILPIHSSDVRKIQKKISSVGKKKVYKKSRYGTDKLRNADPELQVRSIQLMEKMKERYDKLSQGKKGKATILITTVLPPSVTPK